MKIELWSIYFAPVPLGVGPIAEAFAREMAARGHEVTVVASHPHYPTPAWGSSWRRRKRRSQGFEVVELPVYTKRGTGLQRAMEEATYAAKQTGWALRRPQPDVVIATVPSVMCLPAAMLRSRLYGTPFVVLLKDIVSVGAAATGIYGKSTAVSALGAIERAGFNRADRIVVISDTFATWLIDLGVDGDKIEMIRDPSPREIKARPGGRDTGPPQVLVIGNIGLSQDLTAFVEAFERSPELAEIGAKLRITGAGVGVESMTAAITSDRVTYLGVVSEAELDEELADATVGLVTQRQGLREFNLPSKLITYMSCGLPVFSVADLSSELSRVVTAGGGMAVSNEDLGSACAELAQLLSSKERLDAAGRGGVAFAADQFDPASIAARFERVLEDAVKSN